MAVKKAKLVKDEVKVEETPVVDVATPETEEVAVEAPIVEEEPQVDVTPEVVEDTKKPQGNVRIRANKDHHCYIGGEHYSLTAGQCLNVPANVKDILNRAGLLAPL